MALPVQARPSIFGRRFGLAGLGGRIITDGRTAVSAWKDRGDRVRQSDHFAGFAIDAVKWKTTLKGSDGSAVAPTILVAGIGGKCRLTTGAGASTMAVNGSELASNLAFDVGKGGFEFSASLQMAAITTICCFIGMCDTVALSMPFTISGGTLTMNGTNAFGFLFDTAATAATWKVVGGTGAVANAIFDTGVAPVAATDDQIHIEVDVLGNLSAWLNSTLVCAELPSNSAATFGLTPTVAVFRRTTASTTVDVDYIDTRSDR